MQLCLTLKTVSFGPLDSNLLDWASGQGSFSTYVKRLIARDMRVELPPLDPELVRLVDRLVESHLIRHPLRPDMPGAAAFAGGDTEAHPSAGQGRAPNPPLSIRDLGQPVPQ